MVVRGHGCPPLGYGAQPGGQVGVLPLQQRQGPLDALLSRQAPAALRLTSVGSSWTTV